MGGRQSTSFPQAAQTIRSALIMKSVLSSAEHLHASLARVPYCKPGSMTGGALWGDATGVGKASPSVIGLQLDLWVVCPQTWSTFVVNHLTDSLYSFNFFFQAFVWRVLGLTCTFFGPFVNNLCLRWITSQIVNNLLAVAKRNGGCGEQLKYLRIIGTPLQITLRLMWACSPPMWILIYCKADPYKRQSTSNNLAAKDCNRFDLWQK